LEDLLTSNLPKPFLNRQNQKQVGRLERAVCRFLDMVSSESSEYLQIMPLKLSTSKAELCLLEPEIVKIQIKDNAELEMFDVLELCKAKLELVKKRPYSVLLVAGKHSSVSKEAREFAARHELAHGRIAKAIVIKNIAQRIIGNYYVKTDKPIGPVRIFACEQEALNWLKASKSSFSFF
jgi:hypothetical protein